MGIDLIDAARALGAIGDEACRFQHLEMLGDGGPADRQAPGELANGPRPAGKPLEDLAPRGIGKRGEGFGCVSHS